MIYPSSRDAPLPLVLACPSEKVPSPARFHSFLPRIQPFSTQSPTTPHSNRRKVSGENPALFPRPKIGGCHGRFLEQAGIFCPKLPAGGRTADKKAKPPIKRQILGSPDVLGVLLLHWQLFLLLAPNNRESGLRLAHSMKSQSNCF